MSNSHDLKALQVRKSKVESEIKALRSEQSSIGAAVGLKLTELNNLNQQIAKFSLKEPTVSEHALLRYIERVFGVDMEEIKGLILTEKNRKMIDFAGSCRIKCDGVEFVVKDRVVVSVVS